jgi:cytochrome c oxidase subunit III
MEHKHPYHLVEPSPWPILTAAGLLLVAMGTVLWWRGHTYIPLGLGGLLVLGAVTGWFRDLILESRDPEVYTEAVQKAMRFGVLLFIVSELMLFVGFFYGLFDASVFPSASIGNVWPPKSINTLDPFQLPYLNTLILLLSANCITWAHQSLLEGNYKDARQGTALTIFLGIIFLCIQAFEYYHIPFQLKEGIYPSNFFILTGFHGLHVVVGVILLSVAWFRLKSDDLTPKVHLGFEAAAWYWHFVDVVWLFLFVFLYWWGS